MEKIKVNKEVFDALEYWTGEYGKNLEFVLNVIYEQNGFSTKEYLPLNTLTVDAICKCLLFGYELEDTPEEKLLDLFEKELNISNKYGSDISDGYVLGIKKTLDILGIEIKGINL